MSVICLCGIDFKNLCNLLTYTVTVDNYKYCGVGKEILCKLYIHICQKKYFSRNLNAGLLLFD